ncbi:uncharacterized protein isoform X3 [Choristoneura fumiferana]|uniref:uncharacterized protein isoform X3 n=1 Tax=Choristoneura fumiferana TaxID=7141 RepID=UPI003D15363A
MTLARFIETSVQSEESGRCVAATGAAGCRRACMTLQTLSNTARSNRHRKLLPLRQT